MGMLLEREDEIRTPRATVSESKHPCKAFADPLQWLCSGLVLGLKLPVIGMYVACIRGRTFERVNECIGLSGEWPLEEVCFVGTRNLFDQIRVPGFTNWPGSTLCASSHSLQPPGSREGILPGLSILP